MTEPATDRGAELSAEALACVARGWPVFPVHGVVGGRCTCSKKDCDRPGKHPRTKNGLKDASLDKDVVAAWWNQWPLANIGVPTGEGLMVLDADNLDSLLELESTHESLPETVRAETGGGGEHYWFRVTGQMSNSVSLVADGIDIRADGGYVIVPPSSHASGNQYIWDSEFGPEDIAIADCPDWLLRLAKKKRSVGSDVEDADFVVGGGRNDYLTSIAGSMRRKGMVEAGILAGLLQQNRARCRPELDEVEIRRIARSAKKNFSVGADAANDSLGELDVWLKKNRDGLVTKDPGNAQLYLQHANAWKDVLGYNEFSYRTIFIKDGPPVDGMISPAAGDQLSDNHCIYAQHWLAKNTQVSFGRESVMGALEGAAMNNRFHPVRDWLESLEWDGKERIATWLTDYMGALCNDYTGTVGACWLISAVARVFKPGCQADHVLVLEGPQGVGKSTAMEALCGKDWYLPTLPDIRTKDAVQALMGHWVCEIAELDAIRGVSATRVKDFVTQRIDDYRPSYGRFNIARPRQTVFCATTNEAEWMADSTGGRRFWPVRVEQINREGIHADRLQLWAEATHWFKDGKQWWPPQDLANIFLDEQDQRFLIDAWEDLVISFMHARDEVTIADVMITCLNIEKKDWERKTQMRVSTILRRLGYVKRRRGGGQREWYYEKV